MARSCWPARRRAPAIWVGNSNGTSGRVDVQSSSLSKLLGWNWNLEKSIATGTHNSGRAATFGAWNSENSKANRIETMKGPAESGQICSVGRRKIAKKIAKNKRCYANTL